MLSNLLNNLFKLFLYAVLWVFILSIPWGKEGYNLFDKFHEIFVENEVVDFLGETVESFVGKVKDSGEATYSKVFLHDSENTSKKQ